MQIKKNTKINPKPSSERLVEFEKIRVLGNKIYGRRTTW
jgi:hypothetical protein